MFGLSVAVIVAFRRQIQGCGKIIPRPGETVGDVQRDFNQFFLFEDRGRRLVIIPEIRVGRNLTGNIVESVLLASNVKETSITKYIYSWLLSLLPEDV